MTLILITVAVFILASGAEAIHWERISKTKHLAFGPSGRPSAVSIFSSIFRVLALCGLAWSLTNLFLLPPKTHRSKIVEVEAKERRHLLLVLDVSPSMKLQDTGKPDQSRTQRASELIQSLLERTTDEKLHITMVAVYNGAKPVVQESRDLEVILNFLDGLPLDGVFKTGKTRLFDGISEAARIAKPWPTDSTTLLLVSDGDTVPASGMPKMPASIGSTLVLGVGDPTKSSFIDGRQSRQDAGTLQQIAARLGGEYHDGNIKHIPSSTLSKLGSLQIEEEKISLSIREYSLMTALFSSIILAFIPILLYYKASPFSPGSSSNNKSLTT